MNRRQAITVLAGAGTAVATAPIAPVVHLRRVPDGGLQPQAVMDERGKLHLLYYTGDAHEGNLGYTHSANGGVSFSAAIPVNSQPGSAIAAGTIRGAQMAIGREGRVHVAWNGSGAKPPMLYTRLNGNGFDPQRNLMTQPSHLDGGGSIAADGAGNVYVTWHNGEGEANRSVWVAKSRDDGRTFTAEQKASTEPAGACGCCGMKSFVSRDGGILYYLPFRD